MACRLLAVRPILCAAASYLKGMQMPQDQTPDELIIMDREGTIKEFRKLVPIVPEEKVSYMIIETTFWQSGGGKNNVAGGWNSGGVFEPNLRVDLVSSERAPSEGPLARLEFNELAVSDMTMEDIFMFVREVMWWDKKPE